MAGDIDELPKALSRSLYDKRAGQPSGVRQTRIDPGAYESTL